MLTFIKHVLLLRSVSLAVLTSFMPAAVGIWNFMPEREVWVIQTETGEVYLYAEPAEFDVESVHVHTAACRGLAEDPGLSLLSKDDMKGLKGGQTDLIPADAATRLAAADEQRTAGQYVDAGIDYMTIMDDYPMSAACSLANDGMNKIALRAALGLVSEADIDAFEARVGDFSQFRTLDARYPVGGLWDFKAQRAKKAGDAVTARTYYQKISDAAASHIRQFPDHPLQIDVVYSYLESARELGKDAERAAIADLKDVCRTMPRCMSKWSARYIVGEYMRKSENNAGGAWLHFYDMLGDLDYGFINDTLNDPNVYNWIKAEIEYAIGYAHYQVGHKAEALAQYQRVQDLYPDVPAMAEKAGYGHALISYLEDFSDSAAGISGFDSFRLNYPNSDHASKALWMVGNIYFRFEDYTQASQIYQDVISQYPDTPSAVAAADTIDYMMAYLMGSVEVVASNDDRATDITTIVAQLCGPIALQKMLALNGVASTIPDLATLAKTDSEGTTMLGLVEAAAKSGYNVVGVEAANPSALTAPYIAHVDDDHFVLVTEADEETVVIADVGRRSERIARSDFDARWDGKAVIGADTPQLAKVLAEDALGRVSGGSDASDDGQPSNSPNQALRYNCGTCVPAQEFTGGAGDFSSSSTSPTAPIPTVSLPGMPTSLNPPSSTTQGGFSAPGVNPIIDMFRSSLTLNETDIKIPIRGPMDLSFYRVYFNKRGFHRGVTTDTTTTHGNNIGGGWAHNLNLVLQASEATEPNGSPSEYTFKDEYGNQDVYDWNFEYLTIQFYKRRASNGFTEELGHWLRYKPFFGGVHDLKTPTGTLYNFTAVNGDRIARLTSIEDQNDNTITLEYDNATVGVGKLTKVTPPTGDTRFLEFTYSGNLMTKAELKKDTAIVQTVQYAYDINDELTKVTDHSGNTVLYAYGSDVGVTDSRHITSITDKNGNFTSFTWTYKVNPNSLNTLAYVIQVDNPDGLRTIYDRSNTSETHSVVTVTNLDGPTILNKVVYHPGPDNFLLGMVDLFDNPTEFIRWIYEYVNDRDLTKIVAPGSVTHSTYAYTAQGRRSSVQVGADTASTWTYTDPATDLYPTKSTASDGLDTDFEYDGNDLVTKVTHPSMGASDADLLYDVYGQVTKITDPLNNSQTLEYDSVGNMTKTTDAQSNATNIEYDDLGNRTKMTDPLLHVTLYEYDLNGCTSCGGGFGILTKMTDANNDVTWLEYDAVGNRTKVTDPLTGETAFEYDAMNRLTKVVSPAGPGNPTYTYEFDLLGTLTREVDFGGEPKDYFYDFDGQLTKVADVEGNILYTYDASGNLSTVTDGEGHVTDYDYTAENRLSVVTDGEGKDLGYVYDSAGRVNWVGTGLFFLVDPTDYNYSATTGLLESVDYYHSGGSLHDDANYFYDDAQRLTKITDWIDDVNGIQYGYDSLNRVTSITDYDGSVLTYGYDAVGNITSMNDYHGNATTYTYTLTNQLSTITAPGGKVWTYHYNALGQVTDYDHPNGMKTIYSYDDRNRMTKIEHKDGVNVLQSFAYDLDDQGNITTTTHEDGAFWDYAYDGRYRLTAATRNNAGASVKANYTYTYDKADNLLTKVAPFEDNFDDGDAVGWGFFFGTWSAANLYLEKTSTTDSGWAVRSQTEADIEVTFSYYFEDTADPTQSLTIHPRFYDWDNQIYVEIRPGDMKIVQRDLAVQTTLDNTTSATTAQDTWYDVRIVADGANVTVWRKQRDTNELYVEVLATTAAIVTTSTIFFFNLGPGAPKRIDNVRILTGDLSNTTTYTYNLANELTSMTDYNGTTTFAYDDFGRTTSKTLGTASATYSWRYGAKLQDYNSTIPGEGHVTYEYGGDKKRRSRSVAGGEYTWYNWDIGWNVINEEDQGIGIGDGALNNTYAVTPNGPQGVGTTLAAVAGTNPATGAYNYFVHDNLSSTRQVFNQAKSIIGGFEFTPYGGQYSSAGDDSFALFTGKSYDASASMYYFASRYYSPGAARWISRDPLGMVDGPNVYAYVAGDPVSFVDLLGNFKFKVPNWVWKWLKKICRFGCLVQAAIGATFCWRFIVAGYAACKAGAWGTGPLGLFFCQALVTLIAMMCANAVAELKKQCDAKCDRTFSLVG